MADSFETNWPTQLRKGVLELAILLALSEERRYGYQIVSRLREVEGLVVGEGTVYPILSRFKRGGLLATKIVESAEGPPRKYYKLTAEGRRRMTWMAERWRGLVRGIDQLAKGAG